MSFDIYKTKSLHMLAKLDQLELCIWVMWLLHLIDMERAHDEIHYITRLQKAVFLDIVTVLLSSQCDELLGILRVYEPKTSHNRGKLNKDA